VTRDQYLVTFVSVATELFHYCKHLFSGSSQKRHSINTIQLMSYSKSECSLSFSTGVNTVFLFIIPSKVAESEDVVWTPPAYTQ